MLTNEPFLKIYIRVIIFGTGKSVFRRKGQYIAISSQLTKSTFDKKLKKSISPLSAKFQIKRHKLLK